MFVTLASSKPEGRWGRDTGRDRDVVGVGVVVVEVDVVAVGC